MMLQNAALLPPDFCSITQHAHLYPALLQALWQTIHRLPKNFHFRSLFQMLPAPICRNTTMKPPAAQTENLTLKAMQICILTFPTPGILRCVSLPVRPAVSTLRETARLSRPLQKDFFRNGISLDLWYRKCICTGGTFFRLWTLKEAYAKATGNGIAAEIYAASYIPDTDSDGLCFADSETAAHFQIKEAEYNGLRIAAVLSDSAFWYIS